MNQIFCYITYCAAILAEARVSSPPPPTCAHESRAKAGEVGTQRLAVAAASLRVVPSFCLAFFVAGT